MQLSLVRAYRTSPKAVFGIALNLALVGVLLGQESTPRADVANVDFEKSVLPILQAHCIDCHNDSMRMGHLVLETREQMLSAEVVATGDAAESLLIQRLHDRDLGILMPPTGRLSWKERKTLEAWINEGAEWPSDIRLDVNQTPMTRLPFTGIFQLLRNGDNKGLAAFEFTEEVGHRLNQFPSLVEVHVSTPTRLSSKEMRRWRQQRPVIHFRRVTNIPNAL